MSFLETPRFSDRIARDMVGGPAFSTEVVVTAAGFEQRNQNWAQARREYDAAIAVRTVDDFAEIEQHFHAVAGRALGFRFKDWGDFVVTAANGVLRPAGGVASGFGDGQPMFQLVKRYTRGASTHDRDIRKPVSGTVQIRRGGVVVPFGTGSNQVDLDFATGLATFGPDQSRTISSHTPGAAHVINLSSALSPNVVVGQRVFVTTVAGSAAAVLNNRAHTVSAVSVAQLTLSTSTTGLTATGGTVQLYPQTTETLDWAGQFDVPVRFDTDKLSRRVIGRAANGQFLVSAESIPLVEVRV